MMAGPPAALQGSVMLAGALGRFLRAAMQAWELDEGPGRRVLDFSGEPAL